MEARRVSVGLEQSIKSDHFIWLLITGVALLSSDARRYYAMHGWSPFAVTSRYYSERSGDDR